MGNFVYPVKLIALKHNKKKKRNFCNRKGKMRGNYFGAFDFNGTHLGAKTSQVFTLSVFQRRTDKPESSVLPKSPSGNIHHFTTMQQVIFQGVVTKAKEAVLGLRANT